MDILTDQAFFRSLHVLFGIAWIGLLYYFNFVQAEYVKIADPDAKADVFKKLAPNALWWFRWAALFTFLTGVILLHQIYVRIGTEIILGAAMGTIMMLNVWGIIWRNQKIVLGMKDGDAAAAGAKAGLASRTNTLFSVPMLMYMVYSVHGGNVGMGISMNALYLGLAIIFAIEANAIWGKMIPAIASVRAVIISSFALAIIMKMITDLI
ncbi:MAG: antitermination protein NusG [Alphaproteobacteria bacterium]|nr:antitermination protein NusG [Alphaproteobacteria bacterium]